MAGADGVILRKGGQPFQGAADLREGAAVQVSSATIVAEQGIPGKDGAAAEEADRAFGVSRRLHHPDGKLIHHQVFPLPQEAVRLENVGG